MTPREVVKAPESKTPGRDGPSRTRGAVRSRSEAPAESRGPAHFDESPRWWRDVLRRRLLAMADITAAGFAVVISTSIVELPWALAPLPLWILFAKLLGLYDRDHRSIRHLTFDELPAIVAWAVVGTAALALLLPLTPADPLSTGAYLMVAVTAVVAAFALRAGARGLWRRLTPRERTAVIGEGRAGRRDAAQGRALPRHAPRARRRRGARARGDRGRRPGPARRTGPARRPRDRRDGPHGLGADRAPRDGLPRQPGQAQRHLLAARPRGPAAVDLPGRRPPGARVRHLGRLALHGAAQARLRPADRRRSALVLLPLLPIVALAIKLDSRGPGLLRPAAGRPQRQALPDAEVQDDGRGRRGEPRRGSSRSRSSPTRCSSSAATRASPGSAGS